MALIRPRRLEPGMCVAIVAPAGVVSRAELSRGIQHIEDRGYRVVLGDHLFDRSTRCDYLAGDDLNRAEDITEMFGRQDVHAVFCACGGYGSMRIIDMIDWAVVASNPKVFVGYSDITSLHLAISNRVGMVTFHGPMVRGLPNLDPIATEQFWGLLEASKVTEALSGAERGTHELVPGDVEGELAGGCLFLLGGALGTPDAPDFANKIVLLEDVEEAVYRIDRILIQMRRAGIFDHAAGFCIGNITRWRSHEAEPPKNAPYALWEDVIAPLGKPTIVGYPFGHEPNPITLPLGVRALLTTSSGCLTLLDNATL